MLNGYVVTSTVKGVEIIFDPTRLGEILQMPSVGINDYHWISDEHCSSGHVFPRTGYIESSNNVKRGHGTISQAFI